MEFPNDKIEILITEVSKIINHEIYDSTVHENVYGVYNNTIYILYYVDDRISFNLDGFILKYSELKNEILIVSESYFSIVKNISGLYNNNEAYFQRLLIENIPIDKKYIDKIVDLYNNMKSMVEDLNERKHNPIKYYVNKFASNFKKFWRIK